LASSLSPSKIIDDNLERLDEFYQLGSAREEAFMRNISAKMADSGEKIAVLITGGFHTPDISRMLKEQGYSCTVITPTVTRKSASNIYFSVLRTESTRLEDTVVSEGDYEN
jgi:hypothetical protein